MTVLVCRPAFACVLTIAAAAAASPTFATPPRIDPLIERVHGVELKDEYRWMEDLANKDEMLAFVRAENARTRAMLDALPERAWFDRRMSEISSTLARVIGLQSCGKVAIMRRYAPGESMAKLYVRDDAGERLFLDPALVAGDSGAAFGATAISPDCKLLSAHVSSGGSETGRTYIFDVATGKQVGQPIERMWGEFPVTFTRDGQLIYTQMAEAPVDGDAMNGMAAHLHNPRTGADTLLLGNGVLVAPKDFGMVFVDDLSDFALGLGSGARADTIVYVAPKATVLVGKPAWKQVATLDDRVHSPLTLGPAVFMLSAKDNSSGRLVRRPLASDGTPGAPLTVMEGTPTLLLKGISATRDGIYVQAATDGASRLFFVPEGNGSPREIALPFEGTIFTTDVDSDGTGLSFGLTGWAQNMHAFRAVGGKLIDTGLASEGWEGAAGMAASRLEAISADGTSVPLVVVRKAGSTGRAPTIVEGYGGYGYDTIYPGYDRYGMAWLDKGGVLAYCGTRGGGERGRTWHEGGRGANKPRAMEDLAACARTLTERGIAPVKGPVSRGGSMGGTLIPTSAERFPDAFGGMVTEVGVVNATRIAQAENGANQFSEMGDPADPAQFRGLLGMDAYQGLLSASTLPPSMMMIGLNDRRVAPWMTAKWFARARAKWPPASLWLRADENAGHGIGSAEEVTRAERADLYAFAWSTQVQ